MNSVSVKIRIANHEMDIQLQAGDFPDGFNDGNADGEVGHEMPIHNVHVQHGCSGAFYLGDFLAQMRKIRREKGWQDFDHCGAS